LIKSRIGRDGIVWANCKFNNEFLLINTDSQNTLLGHEEQRTQNNVARAAEALQRTRRVREGAN